MKNTPGPLGVKNFLDCDTLLQNLNLNLEIPIAQKLVGNILILNCLLLEFCNFS
jgi:hypothetical protein